MYISDLLVGCHALSPVFSTSLAFCGPCHLGVSSVDLNSVPVAGAKSTGAPNKKGTPNWAKDRQSNVAEKLYVYCPWPRQPTTFSLQNHMSTKKYQLIYIRFIYIYDFILILWMAYVFCFHHITGNYHYHYLQSLPWGKPHVF